MKNLKNELASKVDEQLKLILENEDDELFNLYLKQVNILWPLSITNRILAMIHYGIGNYHVVASKTRWNELAKSQGVPPLIINGKNIYAFPKKGSHGVKLFRPQPIFKEVEQEDGSIKKVCVGNTFAIYTAFAETDMVYAATKEPIKLPDFVANYNTSPLLFSALIQFCNDKNIRVEEEKIPDFIRGFSCGGKIVLEKDDEVGKKTFIIIHEIAHEILHQSIQDMPKFIIEAEAEITASIVMQYFGYKTEKNSAAYIRHHIKQQKIDAKSACKIIKNSMERILNSSQEIIVGIEKYLDNFQKEKEI